MQKRRDPACASSAFDECLSVRRGKRRRVTLSILVTVTIATQRHENESQVSTIPREENFRACAEDGSPGLSDRRFAIRSTDSGILVNGLTLVDGWNNIDLSNHHSSIRSR
jgi:hypothetical protein